MLLLGLDTGGTYTDAVLMTDAETPMLVAKAKALTTRHDLAIGLAGAVDAVMREAGAAGSEIGLVSMSTTLATNALVEGQAAGRNVGLVAIGFSDRDLSRAGLREAISDAPLVSVAGGHTTHGAEAAPLELPALDTLPDVEAWAIASLFAVRNPAHEITMRDHLAGLAPVTCSHELSARLNGPRRALTTWLNAGLLPMISRLTAATDTMLRARGIEAPAMVVRGDGALMNRHFADRYPVETILSGPAASLVGAAFLSDEPDAFVCDIGGTTSDVGQLREGRPVVSETGATVGGHATMVEAVAVRTFGLGSDSEVAMDDTGLQATVALGPRRLVPLSLIAVEHPSVVTTLEAQTRTERSTPDHGRFVQRTDAEPTTDPLLDRIPETPVPLEGFFSASRERSALDRLVAAGQVRLAGFTPTDAMHVAGRLAVWNTQAAGLGATLLARRRDRSGRTFALDGASLAARVITRLHRRLAEVNLETALVADGFDPAFTTHPLVNRALAGGSGAARIDVGLDRPLIGLGASAVAHMPPAAALLGCLSIVPEHAGVANAVGAVVGRVTRSVTITVADTFQIEGKRFASEDEAIAAARALAYDRALAEAVEAGAHEPEIRITVEVDASDLEGLRTFIEARVTALASGRPSSS